MTMGYKICNIFRKQLLIVRRDQQAIINKYTITHQYNNVISNVVIRFTFYYYINKSFTF